ncbi:KH domain-containing protein [Calidifontibacillus oryziterrae]|uniref:KH domain-containing protein n=1 Tax=Calidifontibacillus oryziterrae TaxID=1191699 RepID=UPI000302AE93|nr:KH domain-containing protein [Calidifontibacillus oryziterrae]
MIELIETIVKSLVDYPEDVVVTVNEDDRKITYNLTVHKDDVGKVIGKQGRVAKAIRTVVYAAATNESKRIHLEIM